jgi:hypothetical protein
MQHPFYKLFGGTRHFYPYSMFHDLKRAQGGAGDELGFRNAAAPRMPKPPGEVRIFVVGNSAVHTASLSYGDSLTGQLQAAFAAHGQSHVRVYNFGIESGNCGQSLMLLVDTLVDLAPDLIMVYDGATDLCVPYCYDPRPGYTFNAYLNEIIQGAAAHGRLASLDLIREERIRREQLRAQVRYNTPEWRSALVGAYIHFVEKFIRIANLFGVAVVHVLQPVFIKNHVAEEEGPIACQVQFLEFVKAMFQEAALEQQRLQRALEHEPRVRFANFSTMFQDDASHCFVDYVHVKADRHPDIAKRLFALFSDMLPAAARTSTAAGNRLPQATLGAQAIDRAAPAGHDQRPYTPSSANPDDANLTFVRANVSPEQLNGPGGVPCWKLVEDGRLGTHDFRQVLYKPRSASVYKISFLVKSGERSALQIWVAGKSYTNHTRVNIDLATRTVGSPSALGMGWSSIEAGIAPVEDGWFRCWASALSDQGDRIRFLVAMLSDGQVSDYQGDGRSGMWFGGLTMEGS